MTYWYETPDRQKDAWYWSGLALSFAVDSGLDRESVDIQTSEKTSRLRKRLWWCCYMRDRLLSLSMRKYPRVRDEDFDVPMLTIDDFECQSFGEGLLPVLGDLVIDASTAYRQSLAKLCIEQAKLCVCIGRVLGTQYAAFGEALTSKDETIMMLKPRHCATSTAQYDGCTKELELWHDNLQRNHYSHCPQTERTSDDGPLTDIRVHESLLNLIYLTTISALNRPEAHPDTPSSVTTRKGLQSSAQKVNSAAIDITFIVEDLDKTDCVRYLPPIGVTVLIPAIMVHLRDSRSEDAKIQRAGFVRLCQCWQVLQRLRETYTSADAASFLLQVAKAKIVPSLALAPHPRRAHPAFSPITRIDMKDRVQGFYGQSDTGGPTLWDDNTVEAVFPEFQQQTTALDDASETKMEAAAALYAEFWDPVEDDDYFDAFMNLDMWPDSIPENN